MSQPIPAVIWGDAATFARRRETAAMQYARNIQHIPQCPGEPGLLDDLLHGRRAAARMEAQVWREYAEECERRFADAADHEMSQPVERRPAPGVYSPSQGGAA